MVNENLLFFLFVRIYRHRVIRIDTRPFPASSGAGLNDRPFARIDEVSITILYLSGIKKGGGQKMQNDHPQDGWSFLNPVTKEGLKFVLVLSYSGRSWKKSFLALADILVI